MEQLNIKIRTGMSHQLGAWHSSLDQGHQRMGWKIGFNMPADQERMQLPSAMIGYLTSNSSITGGMYKKNSPTSVLLLEPEVAILIGENSTIAGYAAALELVDTTRSVNDDIEEMLAGNLFHEGVLIAAQPLLPEDYSRENLDLSLKVNGTEVRTLEQQRVPQDFTGIIATVTEILSSQGEQLQAGDWIITGAAARAVPVFPGDSATLHMGALGELSLTIA